MTEKIFFDLDDVKIFHNNIDCTHNLLKYSKIEFNNNVLNFTINTNSEKTINDILLYGDDLNIDILNAFNSDNYLFYQKSFIVNIKMYNIYKDCAINLDTNYFDVLFDLNNIYDKFINYFKNNLKFIYDDDINKLDVTNDILNILDFNHHCGNNRINISCQHKISKNIKDYLFDNNIKFKKIYKSANNKNEVIKIYFMEKECKTMEGVKNFVVTTNKINLHSEEYQQLSNDIIMNNNCEIHNLKNNINDLKINNKFLKNKITYINKIKDDLKNEINNLKNETNDLKNKIIYMENTNNYYVNNFENNFENKIDYMENDMKYIENKMDNFENKIDEFKNKTNNLKNKINDSINRINNLNNYVIEFQNKTTYDFENKIDCISDDFNDMCEKIDHIENKINCHINYLNEINDYIKKNNDINFRNQLIFFLLVLFILLIDTNNICNIESFINNIFNNINNNNNINNINNNNDINNNMLTY